MAARVTGEEFKKRLSEIDGIEQVSEFIGWNKPIKYRCKKCGNAWDVSEARSPFRGYGCPACANKMKWKKAVLLRTKAEEDFRIELHKIQPTLIPNDIYKKGKIKYHCICSIHNIDVFKTPNKLLEGQGCPICAAEKKPTSIRYTHESFLKKLYSINPNVEVLSEYTNIKGRLHVRCKIDGHEWNPIAETLISKTHSGCPKCSRNAIKTTEEFKSELAITHSELTLLSEYVRSNRKVHVMCKDCNNDFWVTPNKLEQGQHCPVCKTSNGEHEIRKILQSLDIKFDEQKRFDGLRGVGNKKLSYDFFLPDHNILIEYQGEQHERVVMYFGGEEKFKKQQEHDRRKREYAKSHNIKLLEIWYYDFDNIEKILNKELLLKSA